MNSHARDFLATHATHILICGQVSDSLDYKKSLLGNIQVMVAVWLGADTKTTWSYLGKYNLM